jgi:hypothetical protein
MFCCCQLGVFVGVCQVHVYAHVRECVANVTDINRIRIILGGK